MKSDKLDLMSPDLVNQNIEKLAALFPNCVTESANGKAIDFDLLKQELNHAVVDGNKERYRLEWPGQLLQQTCLPPKHCAQLEKILLILTIPKTYTLKAIT
jgi:hypothetical protein